MFFKCSSIEEATKLYRKLSKRLHPDLGGCPDLMSLLVESYEHFKSFYTKTEKKKDEQQSYENCYEDIPMGDERLDIIADILEYSKDNKKFKTDYIESVLEFASKNQYVTSQQYNTMVKIYYAFRMNKKK